MSLRGIFEANTRKQNGHWQSGGNNAPTLPEWKQWHNIKEVDELGYYVPSYWSGSQFDPRLKYTSLILPSVDHIYTENYPYYTPLNNSFTGFYCETPLPDNQYDYSVNPQPHPSEIQSVSIPNPPYADYTFFYEVEDDRWYWCLDNKGLKMYNLMYINGSIQTPVYIANKDTRFLGNFDLTDDNNMYLPLPTAYPQNKNYHCYNCDGYIVHDNIVESGDLIPNSKITIEYHYHPNYKYIRFLCPNENVKTIKRINQHQPCFEIKGIVSNKFGIDFADYNEHPPKVPFYRILGCNDFPNVNPSTHQLEWCSTPNKYRNERIILY